MNIKFISYSGKWPNLCNGILCLEVNSKPYYFGYDYKISNNSSDIYYDKFWSSGGSCSLESIDKNEWIIYEDKLPTELKPFVKEISDVFNSNVPYGCCGGCI